MSICHPHNIAGPLAEHTKPFGIRVRLANNDPFATLVGADWETSHWFITEKARDKAMDEMSQRHRFSRIGDEPRLIFERVAADVENQNILS
jgi:hypothetical protein